MGAYRTDDIIFALATPWGTGALAVIRLSGDTVIQALSPYFRSRTPLTEAESGKAVYGNLADLDRCVLTVYRDGHGYTGEEAVEISCHGGLQTVKAILEFLQRIGFRQAGRGEFTLRAFMHGKMDLTRSEAVAELIDSRTQKSRNASLQRLDGNLQRLISNLRKEVLEIMATVEVQLDYAEDETEPDLGYPVEETREVLEEIDRLRRTYSTGKLYSEGARIVLAGPVNAGKSSLFNYMLNEERAIVSPVEGTTRDFIEGQCSIHGIPVRLYDTAGLRESSDVIEEEGIRRSRNLLDAADLILYLAETEKDIDPEITKRANCIVVFTKKDMEGTPDTPGISIITGHGLEELYSLIEEKLSEGVPALDEGELVIQSSRQKDCLDRAHDALTAALEHNDLGLGLDIVAVDVKEALDALGEITGEVTTDDILDSIFSRFCVGK
jgi:tRNA modification GTPase